MAFGLLLFLQTSAVIFWLLSGCAAQTDCSGAPPDPPTKTVEWTVSLTTTTLAVVTVKYGDWKNPPAQPTTLTTTTTATWLAVQTGANAAAVWPAPAIHVQKCQHVEMTLKNAVGASEAKSEDLTVHFHGLLQNSGHVIMDGPEGITQSGIAPHQSYTYRFLADQEGTYWVHSHHPGQYPKGLRAPFIVRNTQDHSPNTLGGTGGYNYKAPNQNIVDELDGEVVTLSDWFFDFWMAEKKGTTPAQPGASPDPDVCGDTRVDSPLIGIEYPPDRVLMNDVGGYAPPSSAGGRLPNAFKAPCDGKRRLRFVNMSALSKFYVWFSDNRSFQIIELDGVSYNSYTTRIFEIASGQRVSILVGGKDDSGTCTPAYIVAASDPKIGRGTKRCPAPYTDPARGVQFTHGYLDVDTGSPTEKPRKAVLNPLDAADVYRPERFKVFSIGDRTAVPKVFHWYPSGSWTNTGMERARDRMDLDYRWLIYCKNTAKIANCADDYGFDLPSNNFRWTSSNDDYTKSIVGLLGSHDFQMQPQKYAAPWIVPSPNGQTKSDFIHFVRLWEINYGLAALMENPNQNDPDWRQNKQIDDSWGPYVDFLVIMSNIYSLTSHTDGYHRRLLVLNSPVGKNEPLFPSLFRALKNGLTPLNDPTKFTRDTKGGRTIMLHDFAGEDQVVHWFVIRSDRGDHPIHLHGHHFQVLAELPILYFDNEAVSLQKLWDRVSDTRFAPANPARRDTLWIEKEITYVIAIHADNPGIWALHCHNDIHAVSGMFSQVVERVGSLRDVLGTWKARALAASETLWDFEFVRSADTKNRFKLVSCAVEQAMADAVLKYTGTVHKKSCTCYTPAEQAQDPNGLACTSDTPAALNLKRRWFGVRE